MSNAQFFQELQDLANYEAKQMQTLPADDEVFEVEFHVDASTRFEVPDAKVTASQHDPKAVCIIVPGISSLLIDSLSDDDLAEFCGIDSEGLIYTNRGEL